MVWRDLLSRQMGPWSGSSLACETTAARTADATFSISRHDISRTIPMLANTVKIAFAAAALMLLTPSADAQQIHPRCAKFNFRDKVGCTCALENGGSIEPRAGGGWRWVHRRGSQAVNEGYIQC